MSRLQVAPLPPPPPPPPRPCTLCGKMAALCAAQRTFISPHLCGLGRDDLGSLPLQPSCHLGKDGGEEEGEMRQGGGGRGR